MKRFIDFALSSALLILFSPVLFPVMYLIYRQDKHSPFYVASRVGMDEKLFNMVKFRSMIINADKSGVDSTGSNDSRITPIGQFVRRYKLDELPQLINVFKGEMSLVGPRPNVKRETDLYTLEEKKLLSIRPGITDLASIVFSDEGDILKNSKDPDIDYNQLIRPWKSRLGIFYVENRNAILDFAILALTGCSVVSRQRALRGVTQILRWMNADPALINISRRDQILVPAPPPGAQDIVRSRTVLAPA